MFALNAHCVRLANDGVAKVVLVAALDDGFQLVLRGDEGALLAWAFLSLEEAGELGRALVTLAGEGE